MSTRGDCRFSALVAKLSDGFSIEEHYQLGVKGHGVLGRDSWRVGKGKPPIGKWCGDSLYVAYRRLWEQWAAENPELMGELRNHARRYDGVLSDRFATGVVNQAHALSDLLNIDQGT